MLILKFPINNVSTNKEFQMWNTTNFVKYWNSFQPGHDTASGISSKSQSTRNSNNVRSTQKYAPFFLGFQIPNFLFKDGRHVAQLGPPFQHHCCCRCLFSKVSLLQSIVGQRSGWSAKHVSVQQYVQLFLAVSW